MSTNFPADLAEDIGGRLKSSSHGTKFERMSRKLMLELAKSGYASFILLRDEEVQKWWDKEVGDARKRIEDRRKKWETYEKKLAAWKKLKEEHRRVLGITKPAPPRVKRPINMGESE